MIQTVVFSTSPWQAWVDTLQTEPATVQLSADPFALAWASYRLWMANRTIRFTDFDHIACTDEDHAQGRAMRTYYQARLTFDALRRGPSNSDFRKKLAGLVNDNYSLTKNDLGILYRLPYFWLEDQAHDRVFGEKSPVDLAKQIVLSQTAEFHVMESVYIGRKRGESWQYWLQSDQSPAPYMIAVASDNPLASLLLSVFNRPRIEFRANWTPRNMRGHWRQHQFWHISNIELA